MLTWRRGREELLLSDFLVTSPARRALKRHPLLSRFHTKSGIASFCIMAFGNQHLEGMGTTQVLHHLQSLPGMLACKAPLPSHVISLSISEATQSSLATIKMSKDSPGAIP